MKAQVRSLVATLAALWLAAAGAAATAATSTSASAEPTSLEPSPGQAPSMVLLIVDIQGFYFEGGAIPLRGSIEAATKARTVLERFRAMGLPVVHVQHLPATVDRPGQDIEPQSYRIHRLVRPEPDELVVGKHHASSFRETELLEILERLGARHLVVVGMQTHMCVEAATRTAADLGFTVTVVSDACATRDLEHGGTVVPAAQVQASTLASLQGSYATVMNADELLTQLGEPTNSGESSCSEPTAPE